MLAQTVSTQHNYRSSKMHRSARKGPSEYGKARMTAEEQIGERVRNAAVRGVWPRHAPVLLRVMDIGLARERGDGFLSGSAA